MTENGEASDRDKAKGNDRLRYGGVLGRRGHGMLSLI